MLELINKRTPCLIRAMLFELKEQEIDLKETLLSLESLEKCFMPRKSFFINYKEKNRLLIVKGLFTYEESRNSLNLISKTHNSHNKVLLKELKNKIDQNIRLILKLETIYYLKKTDAIFFA